MYSVEIDYSSKTANAILENGKVVLFLHNGARVNEENVVRIIDALNSLKITSIAEERKLITNDGKSIIEYVINGTKIVSLNGNVVEKSFNSVCIENSYEFRSAVRNPDDVCALCRNGIEETRKCYVGGWDKCNGMKFKTA